MSVAIERLILDIVASYGGTDAESQKRLRSRLRELLAADREALPRPGSKRAVRLADEQRRQRVAEKLRAQRAAYAEKTAAARNGGRS